MILAGYLQKAVRGCSHLHWKFCFQAHLCWREPSVPHHMGQIPPVCSPNLTSGFPRADDAIERVCLCQRVPKTEAAVFL